MNLLVNPPGMVQMGYTPPPLGLLYIAANDPNTHILDLAINKSATIPNDLLTHAEIVGVSMLTPTRHDALRILKFCKDVGKVTVAGGVHTSVMTKQLVEHYPFIDYWVCGDGEVAWKDLCNGKRSAEKVLKKPVARLDDLPLPAWERINVMEYPVRGTGMHRGNDLGKLPRVSIILGRGCSGTCTFCSTWWVNGRYRAHSKEWMARELSLLWDMGVRHLVWQDDCLTADKFAFYELCNVLANYNFSWYGTSRVDCFDMEIARLAVATGCYTMSFGFESGSPAILRKMNKKTDLEQAMEAREACRAAGLKCTALMMGGFPYETESTQQETREFLDRLKPDEIGSLGHTFILPGTALYQECKRKGLLDDQFWLGFEPYYIYRGGLSKVDNNFIKPLRVD
jgi:radical SAM superfamily enzyme YgiQ (UPF0313 family)